MELSLKISYNLEILDLEVWQAHLTPKMWHPVHLLFANDILKILNLDRSCNAQDSPPQHKIIQYKMSVVAWVRRFTGWTKRTQLSRNKQHPQAHPSSIFQLPRLPCVMSLTIHTCVTMFPLMPDTVPSTTLQELTSSTPYIHFHEQISGSDYFLII